MRRVHISMRRPWFYATLGLGAVVIGLFCPAQPAPVRPPPLYAGVAPSDITAIELERTSCFGRCPAYRVRFTADDRATYQGFAYAPRRGQYAGAVDFARLAAWMDSQHPEELQPEYAGNWIDSPRVTIVVERGTRRSESMTAMESQTPLRFEGIVWALDGLSERVQWRAVDDLTPLLGTFMQGGSVVTLFARTDGPVMFSGRGIPCADVPTTTRVPGGIRVSCGGQSSTFTANARGLRATGDLVPSGDYERVTEREVDRRSGNVARPAPS
jgi:hypothetical protein